MARAPIKTATMFDAQESAAAADKTEMQNEVVKPEVGEKGFKFERNTYGHFVVLWEDGNRDVPVMLQGAFTSRNKLVDRVEAYFIERKQPRTRNWILDKVGV